MTFPVPNFSRVWVRGRFIDLGKAARGESNYGLRGTVQFTPSVKVLVNFGTEQIISTGSFGVTPAESDGYFQLQLPATDDPDVNPTNFTYAVTEPTGRSYNITVPEGTPVLNSPGNELHGQRVLDLASVVPVSAPSPGVVQLMSGRGIDSMVGGEVGITVTYTDGATELVLWPAGMGGGTDQSGRAAALAMILGGV